MRTQDVGGETPADPSPPSPSTGVASAVFDMAHDFGYHRSLDWKFVEGNFTEPGPATAWTRMNCTLVDGEEPSPLTRVLVAADSGNGISGVLDWKRYVFVNTDLSVHLWRYPKGEWVCMRSKTTVGPDGVGLAETELFDETSRIGRSMQTLFIGRR
jgi:hypothetical protein